MEPLFDHDFSHVRLHTDGAAADSARAVDADAYTVGRHIVFATGAYAPNTHSGRRLLAHELAHVVQQHGAMSAPTLVAAAPDLAPERAADAAAVAASSGRRVPEQPRMVRSALARQHRCLTGHTSGQGELVPSSELGSDTLYYRIWSTWRQSDSSIETFATRAVNDWVRWRFGPLAAEDRRKVTDLLFTTALSQLGGFYGASGCDYAIVLSKETLAKATELSGEGRRAAAVRSARTALESEPGGKPDIAKASIDQRIVLLEDRIRLFWTGGRDEEAILDILRKTPDDQAAELSRRLASDRFGDETYLDALDRVVDLGNNLELHTALTRLHLKGLGEKQGLAAIQGAPVLPWHDVMGFGEQPATFSVRKLAGKVVIDYHQSAQLLGTNAPFAAELKKLPVSIFVGGQPYDADQLFVIHDWDEGKFVPVRGRDLVAYQHIGVRNFLGHVGTVASLAIPVGAATTAAGRAAAFVFQRALPLLIAAIRENRLNIVKWWPVWGPRMIYFADVAEMAMALYGVASFLRSGAAFIKAWRDARFARLLWEAGEHGAEAEKSAVALEQGADKVLNAADEFQRAEIGAQKMSAADLPKLDLPGDPVANDVTSWKEAAAARQARLAAVPQQAAAESQQVLGATGTAGAAPRASATGSGGGPTVTKLPPGPTPQGYTAVPKDVPHELPAGTHGIGTTTRPRTSAMTDPEVLAVNLTKRLGTRPLNHAAHHIVPKGMKEAEDARAILRRASIGINDAENGIWLPNDYSVVNTTTGEIHASIHTQRYIAWITDMLKEAEHSGGPDSVRRTLEQLQALIGDASAVR
jgi:Domain of unknown function (DUF4157)/A nuclease family of the HNH/ENDO VII superfamily with conserved AHH